MISWDFRLPLTICAQNDTSIRPQVSTATCARKARDSDQNNYEPALWSHSCFPQPFPCKDALRQRTERMPRRPQKAAQRRSYPSVEKSKRLIGADELSPSGLKFRNGPQPIL